MTLLRSWQGTPMCNAVDVRSPRTRAELDAVVAARGEHAEWEDLRVDGFGLRFELDGVEESVDLDPPYEESDVQGDGLVEGKKEVS